MSKFYILLFFSLLLVTICEEEDLNKIPEENIEPFLTNLIDKNLINYNQLIKRLDYYSSINDIKKSIASIISKKLNKLEEIKHKFIDLHYAKIILPSIIWNEDKEYIYLKILYKKNFDENILCKELDKEVFDFSTDSNLIHFEGFCYDEKEKQQYQFVANLELLRNLNKLQSFYNNLNNEKNGNYQVALKKKEKYIWNDLLSKEKRNKDKLLKNIKRDHNFKIFDLKPKENENSNQKQDSKNNIVI